MNNRIFPQRIMFYILCWYYSYIDIDIYGGNSCSKLKCSGNCMDMVNTTYKFYLSFENSLCKDYITEKFWKVLPYNVIPIVLNGVDMSTLAPYHSYIDIKDFPSFEGGWRDDIITFPFKTKQGQMPIARGRNPPVTLTLSYFMFDWIAIWYETGTI